MTFDRGTNLKWWLCCPLSTDAAWLAEHFQHSVLPQTSSICRILLFTISRLSLTNVCWANKELRDNQPRWVSELTKMRSWGLWGTGIEEESGPTSSGTVAQQVELLSHSTRDPGLILTWVAVYAELAHSPRDRVGLVRTSANGLGGLKSLFPHCISKLINHDHIEWQQAWGALS